MGAKGRMDILCRCSVCLKNFWASKRSADTCSARCRKRKQRNPPLEERIGELYDDAHVAIMGIVALTGGRDFDGYRAQQRLKSLFLEIVNSVDDRTRRVMYDAIKDDLYRVFRDTSVSHHRPEVETIE